MSMFVCLSSLTLPLSLYTVKRTLGLAFCACLIFVEARLAGKDTAAAAAGEDASTITSAAEEPPGLAARRVFTHRTRLLAVGDAIGEAGLGGEERVLLLGLCNDAVDVPSAGSGSGSGSGSGFTFGLEFGLGLKVAGSEFGRRLRLGRATTLWLWLCWRGLRT